jgi:hypothetical protein
MLMIFPQLKVIELRFCNDAISPAAFGINYDTSVQKHLYDEKIYADWNCTFVYDADSLLLWCWQG